MTLRSMCEWEEGRVLGLVGMCECETDSRKTKGELEAEEEQEQDSIPTKNWNTSSTMCDQSDLPS